MIELNLASFAGGSLAVWAASEWVMPMLLQPGESVCIQGGSGSDGGIVVSPADKSYTVLLKLAVDGIAFFIGMMVGQYIGQRFMRQ